jgi:CubicO group peptidase (beta-lactamase class C family)
LVIPSHPDDCRAATDSPTIFQAASLSKPVVATLALKLALGGKLDLDRPLSESLPDGHIHRQNLFALRAPPIVDVVPSELLKKVTARELLSHTSGLPNWSPTGPLRLTFEPGARWQYSGEGYVLIQHLLQSLTGVSLNELAAAELFRPLGLRDCAFKLTERISQSLVPGRSASGKINQLRFPYEIAASSLYTSAADYATFMASVLADERLLSLVTHAPVQVPKAPNVYWGLGWGIERTSEGNHIWHWGNNPGFRTLAMADLSTKDAIVALVATDTGMPRAKSSLREALPGLHPGLDLYLVQ